jgi:hypothetical protein
MPEETRHSPFGITWLRGRLADGRARIPVLTDAIVPFGIAQGDARKGDLLGGDVTTVVTLSAAKHLERSLGRAHHTRLRQIRERIAQLVRVRILIAVGWPLQPERILDTLLRIVRANHP